MQALDEEFVNDAVPARRCCVADAARHRARDHLSWSRLRPGRATRPTERREEHPDSRRIPIPLRPSPRRPL